MQPNQRNVTEPRTARLKTSRDGPTQPSLTQPKTTRLKLSPRNPTQRYLALRTQRHPTQT